MTLAPEIKPIAEIYPGYDLGMWQSIVAPSGVSREVIDRIGAAIRSALSDPERRQKILNAGIEPAFSQSDLANWSSLCRVIMRSCK
jgi:tripartite-type tricarboxylate transporter receptor subunit TctC